MGNGTNRLDVDDLKDVGNPTIDNIRTDVGNNGRVAAAIRRGEHNVLVRGASIDQRHGYSN